MCSSIPGDASSSPSNVGRVAGVPETSLNIWKVAVPALVVIALVAGSLYFYFRSRATKPLTEKDTIVLADFTNSTGDAVFDGTLRQGLAAQLEQSPFLSLISDQRIAQ